MYGGKIMNKTERLMAIILALKDKEKITAKELSSIFEVDIRTIYRDMDALGQMNIPITSNTGADGGYTLLDHYFIPPIMFNREEIFALLLAKKAIGIIDIPGYNAHCNSAFLKLESLVSGELKKDLENIYERIVLDINSKDSSIKSYNIFDSLEKALKENFKVKVFFHIDITIQGKSYEVIHPYGILFENSTWYIVGFSESNNSDILLRIDSIKDICVLNDTFILPKNFSMEDYYSTCCFKNATKNPKSVSIKLKVCKNLYSEIKDFAFIKYGNVVEDNDCFYVTVKTSNIDTYISLAFKFFKGIEIIEPLWVREKFKEQLVILNKTYEL